ncbi:methyltransferase domain-containing protein [Pseudanabaena sp. FACHB-1277]|uniref:Methyltransferase domain-containing protein n=1 Tax=Pseudanabaena cinerea FACHB-1277 TaxID=2949581 RepID=A0A926Z6T8_9CYAN|nr:methyltransferase domain-containing protein [Pseudanabaena cinerea]MBD2151158.1 methyltransferase domain-containing protein [Pseudanabaena cinerea FACHB-1277]
MQISNDIPTNDYQEIQRLLNVIDGELIELSQLLFLLDLVWDEMNCDNINLDAERINNFYKHPVWLLNGFFAEQHSLSLQHRCAISSWITANHLKTVLDFGGGYGTLARMISGQYNEAKVDIYEPYPSEFAISQCQDYPSVEFVNRLQTNHYDCLVSTDVLEHVPEPLNLFSQMIDSVKIGGYLIIANCFFPIIKCHLPSTFHLRYTFDRFAIAMGLEVMGNCIGSHATIYKKVNNYPVNWEQIERMSLVSKRLFFLREL